MTTLDTPSARPSAARQGPDLARLSAWCGIAFVVCQVAVMAVMITVVLPHGGSLDDPAVERGRNVQDAADVYRLGNFALMLAGSLLLGFLGAVHVRLRQADPSGVLATIAVAAGTLLALVWPLGGLLHDVALGTADLGTDLRILAGWDAVAPYSLAFSVLPRAFLLVAVVLALRLAGGPRALQWSGAAIVAVSLVGSATLVSDALFPALAISTLAYELWLGAVAWHWLRDR